MDGLIYCRAGFEPEAAAELQAWGARAGVAGYARTDRLTGYVVWCGPEPAAPLPSLAELIFARQVVGIVAELRELDPADRITPLLAALEGHAPYGDVVVEHPDSDAARPLAGLARSFANALRPALRAAGRLTATPQRTRARLHVCFVDGRHLFVGRTDPADASPWPGGIPRLRLPASAPSRSALKLEEALLTLLTQDERTRWLRPGMKAADLGAAPGGWSWVLARAGLQVTAIDNGPLADAALDTGLIRHLRADGFAWQPAQPLDWMVCDMVEQPRRVAARMAEWIAQGWCRRTIFNLKLPMKKRWAEVQQDLAAFASACAAAGQPVAWRARQLYHDREEITVYAGPAHA